ncbi:hypothetical protein GCM10011512_12530 [Tersicoccus solisilvae]|uniref:Serine protease n=1 Tax=Tersicoccus solisilvae TaxID=1882339 RepID=A0ABQ1NXN6_9MICC|nr:serine protease [Tersicoccus solisilvae]GGC87105.1 hypothetical protein GCM10011512_12530 [Tersicoccus solisilvae]
MTTSGYGRWVAAPFVLGLIALPLSSCTQPTAGPTVTVQAPPPAQSQPQQAQSQQSGSTTTSSPAATPPAATPPVASGAPVVGPTPPVPPADPTWADVYSKVKSGVALIEVTTCDGGGHGTGFVVGPNLVMTAAHVVDGQTAISVSLPGGVSSAQVIGFDPGDDLALLRLDDAVQGYRFAVQQALPSVASDVATIGFPLGAEMTFTEGRVSTVNAEIDGVSGLIKTDTAINHGNSGGPLLDNKGRVVGVVVSKVTQDSNGDAAEGIAYAVNPLRAVSRLAEWRDRTTALAPDSCSTDGGGAATSADVDVTIESSDPSAASIAQTLQIYGQAINRGAYETAFDVYTTDTQQQLHGLDTWKAGLDSVFWRSLVLTEVRDPVGDRIHADVTVQTQQDTSVGRNGQTCSIWTFDYTMVWTGTDWKIEKADAGAPAACS